MRYSKNEIIKLLAIQDLNFSDAKKIVSILKENGFVEKVIYADTASSVKFVSYLAEFWSWEKSAYIKEKIFFNQSIHRKYTERNVRIVKNHYVPFFGEKLLGEILRGDIKEFQMNLLSKKLSPESVNQITRVGVTALKWAYNNKLMENSCFENLHYCSVVHKKREILSMEDAVKLFSRKWKNADSKLANLIAMCTGLRAGEIQALRKCDVGSDRLYIRHAWSEFDGKLKCPKNGDEREVPAPSFLIKILQDKVKDDFENAFVLKRKNVNLPQNSKLWRRNLYRELKLSGIKTENIVFHSWRHFYSTYMSDYVELKKLKSFTGHKSMEMINHYSNHIKQTDFETVKNASELLFKKNFQTFF